MSGVAGWFGLRSDTETPSMAAILDRMSASAGTSFDSRVASSHALCAAGLPGTWGVFQHQGLGLALSGHPCLRQGDAKPQSLASVARELLEAFSAIGPKALEGVHGDFALAIVDRDHDRLVLAVDRMSIRSLVYAEVDGGIVFGPTCDVVASHPRVRREVDPQRLYDYLYFHMVPGPATVFRGMTRVAPGHHIEFSGGRCTTRPHWQAHFVEDSRSDFATLKQGFREALRSAVAHYAPDTNCGAFLSGGTDSSTIAGLLGNVTGAPAQTFSIGFDAEGFDEMQYARIAAAHFRTAQHEYYVTPDDVVDALPRIAAVYDQPFGNASAVPTYYCARLARDHGITRILGGDGGDELFGGNARYARQHQFARYERIPAFLRNGVLEPALSHLPMTERIGLLRKARSYIAQASMPMPERYESYNLLERLGPESVLSPEFLLGIDRSAPIRQMRAVYQGADAQSLINRMLALDFQFTMTDNDLPKVTRMCELAGIDVAFPMLDEKLMDFSLRLAPELKLRGTRLRYFFKEALKDFLPPEIITKRKHGFGLPVGAWLCNHPGLRSLAGDAMLTLRRRGIVRPAFIDQLVDHHLAAHAGYYGTMVWILMMLELWFQRHTTT